MDLEVAPVDARVVGDDELRQALVAVVERGQHALELTEGHVESAQRGVLELEELRLEGLTALAREGHQLNFPVTYSSVRELAGALNNFSVSACSTSSPR